MKNIKSLPSVDRPREKLEQKGVKSLSDFELIQLLLGSGTKDSGVRKLSRRINKLLENGLENISLDKITSIKGIGIARASKILAAFELTQRYTSQDTKKIQNTEDCLDLLEDIRDKQQEYFVALSLDGANRLIEKRTISIGTLTASLVHPREVFADAVTDRAARIIVAHNHPSGNLHSSEEDVKITKKLAKAGEVLGIELLDHIIVTKSDWESIKV